MWFSTLIVFSLALFISCMNIEDEPTKVEEQQSVPQLGDGMWEEAKITGDELKRYNSLCKALDAKRVQFRRNYLGLELNYGISSRDCDGNSRGKRLVKFKILEDILNSSLILAPTQYRGEVMSEVLTSEEGPLSYFCPDILRGNEPLNTVETNGGANKIQIRMLKNISTPTVQIKYLKNHEDKFEITSMEEISVNSNSQSRRVPYGLVIDRIKMLPCVSDGQIDRKKHQLLRQAIDLPE